MSSQAAATSSRTLALKDADTFLSRYVAPNGRVIRRDQGGDTVSEGQGYGLLLAYVANQQARFAQIADWTTRHLQQSNGLFAYHWSGGRVVSAAPAADADTQIAWALDLAGTQWHKRSYLAAAKRTALAVAQNEIGYDAHGHPTLTAGPWANQSGQPVTVEPGYWTYPADNSLARLTGDNRWKSLAAGDLSHLQVLSANGTRLPADWATETATVSPASPPGSPGTAAASGQDGLRALAWGACTAGAATLERHWWSLVASSASQAPLVRGLDGAPQNHDRSPLSAVAAAVAASAAGHPQERDELLNEADQIAQQYPTYYGWAWAALGRVVTVPGMLPGCG
jgi:endoglucanase